MTKDALSLATECYSLASGMEYALKNLAQEYSTISDRKIADAVFGLAVTAEVIAEKAASIMDASFSAEEA